MRAGLDREPQPLGLGRGDHRERVGARTGAGCAPGRRSRGSRSIDLRRWRAPRPPRDASRRNPAYPWPCGRGARVDGVRRPRRARSSARRRSPVSAQRLARARSGVRCGNSSTPECSRKHLKPKTPASCSGRRSGRLPGTAPPQKPDVDVGLVARDGLALRAPAPQRARSGGMLLSGMSMIVVTPPAAAALVALTRSPPTRCGPGSLTCTWASTRPGQQHLVVGELDDSAPLQVGVERLDRDDLAVLDPDQATHLATRAHHAAGADHQVESGVEVGHAGSPSRVICSVSTALASST